MSNLLTVKFENHKIPEFREVKNKEWVYFGEDNQYPEYLIELALRSAKHGAVLAGKVNYIYGQGLVYNEKGTSLQAKAKANDFIRQINKDGFLRKMIQDFEWFNGFYIEPIWNKRYTKIVSINYIPFSKIRVSADEETYFYSNDWKSDKQSEEKTGLKTFSKFDFDNPKPNQLYYYKIITPKNGKDRNVYPVPEYIGACASIETDIEIANYHLNNIKTGFSVGSVLSFNNGDPGEEGRKAIENAVKKKFTGTDRAGSLMISFNNAAENAPTVTSFAPSDLDKQFIEISKRVEQDIFIGHKISDPSLFGAKSEGVVFERAASTLAREIFQADYVDLRQKYIEDVINEFAQYQGVTCKIEFKDVHSISKQIPDSVYQRLYDAYDLDTLADLLRMPKVKKVIATEPIAMSSEKELYDVLFEMDFNGQSEDEILSSYKMSFASELSANEKAIIDLLSKDSLTPTRDIAKVLKITDKEVNKIISALDEGGYLSGTEPTSKGTDIVDEEGAKTELTEIKYRYTWRPGVTPDEKSSRPKCVEWLTKYEKQSGWLSRSEIDNLDNGQDLPVWESRGGWWNQGTANVPFCRHIWKAMVVKKK